MYSIGMCSIGMYGVVMDVWYWKCSIGWCSNEMCSVGMFSIGTCRFGMCSIGVYSIEKCSIGMKMI